MTQMVEASVIIPAFNAERFLEAAIRSALAQTLRDIEVIVVDDGSSDRTLDLALKIGEGESGLKVLRHDQSRGPSAARNTAIRSARGRWIAVLDADDTFAPDRLEVLISSASRLKLDVIADNLNVMDAGTEQKLGDAFPDVWMEKQLGVDLEYILVRDWPGRHDGRGLGFLKPVFSRDFLLSASIEYAEDVRAGEDLLFLANLVQAGAKLGLSCQSLYNYSVRKGSLSQSRSATFAIVDVNHRLEAAASESERSIIDFKGRAASWLYQGFATSLKGGAPVEAFAFARKLGLGFIATRLSARVWRGMRDTTQPR